ncbi:MAG: TrkH family potassium uptake protein [Clostridia bacterium]|nr:TrkH family potassium uptake protein [Clostridia bacterium]
MNYKMVVSMTGLILRLEAALLVLPTVIALIYRESTIVSFLITIGITLGIGIVIKLLCKTDNSIVYAKDGFVIVTLSWLCLSAFGALPFFISGEIPSYVDAFFETVSGFTTTGASILKDVEVLSKSIQFWRSFTHWIGGMGIIVLVMAIFPTSSGRSMHIMRAEMPGPIVGKLVPRVKNTAKILYLIYIALTLMQIVLLTLGDMNLVESIVHSFGTAGTGGFGIMSDSIGSYSAYSQWVIAIFMLIFGINFNLFYLILIGRVKNVLKSEELHAYIGIVVFSIAAICMNVYHMYSGFSEALRHTTFQVSSIMTTTGFATTDFNTWPSFSKAILLVLMFIGGCAGSTAGGLKVSRIVLIIKIIANNIRKVLNPRAVGSVRFEGKMLDETTRRGISNYLSLYFVLFFLMFLVVSLDRFDFETNFSAVAACFNNIGPGFSVVGPTGSFADYSVLSKFTLSAAMLLGRLELYPLLIMFLPTTWRRAKNVV